MNAILPIALIASSLIALLFAFSKPVGLLPRWVRHAYILLWGGMVVWGIVTYFAIFRRSSLSEHAYSLILQARAWLAGFSLAIVIVLMLAGAFPKLFGSSRKSS